ncbi:hypothetical protein HRW14_19610 [Streptomyces lunaelactis]|uniref:hypothetical protein n=1 Tax=Streptomyces lunaelactis TaxID=1535768 RepID=UPI00158523F3|nr:hypothetical protein [Streptomyces lunaelactis]NUK52447.1 hypothetical protein [Streptomyces lunaelactis]NUK66731.1 hypothetical protein [Streptomyces lunaelactis]
MSRPEERPRLADVFPEIAAEIVRLLRKDDASLAETVHELRYYGHCLCRPGCQAVLTAPAGSAGTAVCQLEDDGEYMIWLSLDPAGNTITDVEAWGDPPWSQSTDQ